MNELAESFSHTRNTNRKLLIQTIIYGICYVGFIILLIYTFNYLDAEYYYWAPALAVVMLGLLTLYFVYNGCRFAASFQIGMNSSFYSSTFAKQIKEHYEQITSINNNVDIHLK